LRPRGGAPYWNENRRGKGMLSAGRCYGPADKLLVGGEEVVQSKERDKRNLHWVLGVILTKAGRERGGARALGGGKPH